MSVRLDKCKDKYRIVTMISETSAFFPMRM